ncbi:YHS domain-containing protein [Luteolibacter soli]|uniref:YHS domain-containing protein n=1 Tax=Luteolibacter soli TaxID=3135280 RepID=A0ABU9B1H5_9BACT
MKPTLLLTILAFGLVSCASPAPATATGTAAASAKVTKKTAAKPKPYPLKTCLVTGDGLDEMDERVSTVYEGQTFEFCCKPCLKKFNKNPGKYVKALEKEKAKAKG